MNKIISFLFETGNFSSNKNCRIIKRKIKVIVYLWWNMKYKNIVYIDDFLDFFGNELFQIDESRIEIKEKTSIKYKLSKYVTLWKVRLDNKINNIRKKI